MYDPALKHEWDFNVQAAREELRRYWAFLSGTGEIKALTQRTIETSRALLRQPVDNGACIRAPKR